MASETSMEGFLTKNHAGAEYKFAHNKRWFTSTGFHVVYYSAQDKRSLKGHFDLRNVLALKPSEDESAGAGAIDMRHE